MNGTGHHQCVVRSSSRSGKRAFTLIEVLVVVAIIALLVSVLLPSLSRAREMARIAVCSANLRTVGQATNFYLHENRDYFPSSGEWCERIYRYVQKVSYKERTDTPVEDRYEATVEFYICPSDVIPHASGEKFVKLRTGDWVKLRYWSGYGISTSIVWDLKGDLTGLLNGTQPLWKFRKQEWVATDPNGQNREWFGMRKMGKVRRPSSIVMYLDSGDDDLAGDQLWDFDPNNHNKSNIQVHHRFGNNFLYADYHGEFKQVIKSGYQQGKPPYPWSWVPIDGWKIDRDTYNPGGDG